MVDIHGNPFNTLSIWVEDQRPTIYFTRELFFSIFDRSEYYTLVCDSNSMYAVTYNLTGEYLTVVPASEGLLKIESFMLWGDNGSLNAIYGQNGSFYIV